MFFMKINIKENLKKINIRGNLIKYRRVLQIATKPTKDELKKTSRICGIGFIVMGLAGFIFYVMSVLGGGL